jgi:hypothetical protein
VLLAPLAVALAMPFVLFVQDLDGIHYKLRPLICHLHDSFFRKTCKLLIRTIQLSYSILLAKNEFFDDALGILGTKRRHQFCEVPSQDNAVVKHSHAGKEEFDR